MGKSWAEKGEGIRKERKEIKRIYTTITTGAASHFPLDGLVGGAMVAGGLLLLLSDPSGLNPLMLDRG